MPGTPAAAFSVSAITPASGATEVPLNATIQITFSSAADASTVNTTNVQLIDHNPVAGTVSYNSSTNSAIFTPAAALAANTTYTVKVSGVSGSSGTAMADPFTSSFTTVTPVSLQPPGAGGNATVQYQAPLLTIGAPPSLHGQISIDTSGSVTVELTGAAPDTSYTLQFCPAVNPLMSNSSSAGACFNMGAFSSDGSGDGNFSAKFPRPGPWAGDFALLSGGNAQFQTSLAPNVAGETFLSTLQPQKTVNGTGVNSYPNQEPLSNGTVTYSNGMIQFTLAGATPNLEFQTNESETPYLDGSGTYACNTFTTDSHGNASSTVTTAGNSLCGPGGDLFQVQPGGDNSSNQPAAEDGFIGGFSVPQ